ncbi:MAG: putative exosortase B-associated extracellular polysaccharide biosynthesis transporter EpsL [Rhodoferax sp.]|nr:putative exosortase B-associated extracellular polysaccharide biosynthesis transporter EpsL [Rhodoferax sp.]
MAPPHLLCRTALAALATSAMATCWAEGGQDLQLRATATVASDSNLFRLPAGANTLALTGRSSSAETIGIAAFGVNYNKTYSLQAVELFVNFNKYSYQNFAYLGFTALNYRAAWRWAYTPRLRGNLTATRDQTLNNFVDFQGFNVRNVRVDSNNRLDATYELGANWRLIGGLTQNSRDNSVQVTQESDFRQTGVEGELRYVLASGSSLGYLVRSTDGNYTSNRTIPSPGFFDDRFSQTDNELNLAWAITPSSSANFRLGHRSRSNPTYPQRDFAGTTGAASVNWAISPKSAVLIGWTRELGSFETNNFNFTQSDRIAIGPVWQVSPKATVRAQLARATRDFRGTPTGMVTQQRRDITRDTSLSVDWQPFNYLSLSAALQNGRRSSSLPGIDYNSNSVNLSAQFSF